MFVGENGELIGFIRFEDISRFLPGIIYLMLLFISEETIMIAFIVLIKGMGEKMGLDGIIEVQKYEKKTIELNYRSCLLTKNFLRC